MAFYGMTDREVLAMPFCRYTALTNHMYEMKKQEAESITSMTKKAAPGRRGK
jgi:hypothetical protein